MNSTEDIEPTTNTENQVPEPEKLNPVLIALGIVIMLVSIAWFVYDPSFEPLLAIFGSILGLFSYVSIKNKRVNWFLAAVAVIASIVGICLIICKQPPPPLEIVVVGINYDGVLGRNEPDEYVEIRNDGKSPINLSGWILRDKADLEYLLPDYTIQPGETCRVYTCEDHPEWCGINIGCGSAIWNNTGGDCAYLSDPEDNLVSEFCYD